MKKILITICLSLSSLGLQSNQTVDDLVLNSGIIVSRIDAGIQGVGGFIYYAPSGGIAVDGVLQAGYINFDEMMAYNDSLTALQNTTFYSAQDYLEDQADVALANMDVAVDNFVEAVLNIVEVIEVQEQATKAQETNDIADQEALQDYVKTNDVYLTEQDISEYNQSLTDVESYGQQAAAFISAANDKEITDSFQEAADTYDSSFLNATATFDSSVGMLNIMWTNAVQQHEAMADLNAYYKTAEDFFATGLDSEFYLTGPTVCGAYFDNCEYYE